MQTLLLTLIDAGAAALSYRVGVEEPAQVQAGAVILIRRADAADDLKHEHGLITRSASEDMMFAQLLLRLSTANAALSSRGVCLPATALV